MSGPLRESFLFAYLSSEGPCRSKTLSNARARYPALSHTRTSHLHRVSLAKRLYRVSTTLSNARARHPALTPTRTSHLHRVLLVKRLYIPTNTARWLQR